jgi:ATP-dependent Clp protease ATP-binding subunit ClpC
MNLLLQILEEGKLTDSLGRAVDFRNTIVIMTSNLGADFLRKGGKLGFGESTQDANYETLKGRMLEEAKRVFKPELVNRIDDIVVFRQLNKEDVINILEVEVAKVVKRVQAKAIELVISDSAKEFLIGKGYDPLFGARPLRRAIERYLEDPLAEEILRGNIHPADTVEVTEMDHKLHFGQLAGAS